MNNLAKAGRRVRAKMEKIYPHMRQGPVTIEPAEVEIGGTLEDVDFGSVQAYELALEADLTWEDFTRSRQGASSIHGYLVGDVRAVIEDRDDRTG